MLVFFLGMSVGFVWGAILTYGVVAVLLLRDGRLPGGDDDGE